MENSARIVSMYPVRRLRKSEISIWTLAVLLCLGLQLVTAANPLKNPSVCGRRTCIPGEKFKYQEGQRYQYQYSVDARTMFGGTSKNESAFHVDAELALDFISPCEGILTVARVSLAEKAPVYDREEDTDVRSPDLPHAEEFHRDITEHPLRFSFQDGVISEVCPNETETTWVLNFKRGILSAFQNTMKRFDVDHHMVETDVNGDCETSYSLVGARETSLAIAKKKDIFTCTNRYKHHSILQMTPYVFPSSFKSTPIMRSTSACEIIIDHNIYSKVVCEEKHVFQPFSGADSGALTTTRQVLTLVVETNATLAEQSPVARRASLLFDHQLTPKPTSGELKASRDLIKTMCRLNTDDVQLEFPDVFTKFIHTARLLSYPALTQVVSRAGSMCSTGKRHVYDALPLLGSNAAITVMKDIIFKDGVPSETVHEWLMALAFVPRPDLATVTIVTPLLYHEKADAQFTLSISSVVHTYCKYAHVNCAHQEEVLTVLEFLEKQVIVGCQKDDPDRTSIENTQVALKAIGNMGIPTSSLRTSLQKCLTNEKLPMAIRVNAVEAHRRFPCEMDREYFLALYRDQTVDPEVRIASYLKVMKCPNYLVVMTIQHALQEEEVNQVGSFVWSHLENLLATSIPSRIEIQGLLQDKDLIRKFSSDVRKFSHNYEGSMFFDEYNIGGNYESNVIFSPKSYMPRSAMLNLTVDLFGESINVFEVAGRMEGFEHYVESLFGPKGPLSANNVRDQLSKYRFARGIPDNLVDTVAAMPDVIDNNFNEPKATLGIKIFGNELKYKSFVGDAEIRSSLASINPWEKLRQLLSGQEVNFKKAALFMDTSYIIPTGIGLPVTLSAVGTAAINLKIAGKLNAADFMKTKELDLEGKLKPSIAMDVVGSMGVDAYYASTGIKLKTNLFSSAAVEGNMKIRGSKLVSVTFSLPKDRTDIVSARSELIVMHGEREEAQAGITENRVEEHMCSWPSLDRTLGLNLCVDFQFPNATLDLNASHSILNGPTTFGISLNKADPTAKQYLLEYKWDTTETTTFISLMFDTPGSHLKRELSAQLNLDRQSQNLTLHLRSADSSFLAQGTYKYELEEKYINFGLELNGKRHLDAQVGLKSRKGKYGYTHHPRLYIAINNERIAELSGSLKWVDKKDIAQCDVNLEFHTKKLQTKLFGYIRKSEASVSFDVKLDYKFEEGILEIVHVQAELTKGPVTNVMISSGKLSLTSTQYPQFNFEASLKYKKAPGHLDCLIEINTKPHLHDDRFKLTLEFVFKYNSAQEGNKMNTFLKITKPISEIDLMFMYNYHSQGDYTKNANAVVRYATGKEITVTINLILPSHTLNVFDVKLNVTVPSFTPMVVALRLQGKASNEYDVTFSATWFSGHSISAKGLYQDRSTYKGMHYFLKLAVKSPSFEEVSVNCKFLKDNQEFRIDFQADYLNDKYAILLKHAAPSPSQFENYAEVKYKSKVYSLTTLLNLQQARQLLLELHLDQYRDIHLSMRGINKPNKKEAGVEIKWDANRDPGQKFAAAIEFYHPAYMNYSGNFMVSFPGRTVKGAFVLEFQGTNFLSSAHLEWSPHDVINIKLLTTYDYTNNLVFRINSELLTPFANWRRTSLAGGFTHEGNMMRANGSVYWQDNQHIALDIFGDYFVTDPDFRCELNASVISTIPQVSSMSGSFFHKHNHNKYITNVLLENNPKERISVHSEWTLDEEEQWSNLTGVVHLVSPFAGYRKGALISQIHVNKNRDIRGVADLELEKRQYTLSLEGHLKQITNSMLEFNITTPIPKYHTITGRFGYSEARKHLIAKLRGPAGAIGIEILFSILSTSDFDVKFHVATPIEFIQQILLVGKLNPHTADFRCGWNNLTLGFTGVWHYESITDFEYSYIVYTPLDGFEQNGVTARLIHKEKLSLDFETSVKLADIKLGVKLQGEPKAQVLNGVLLSKKTPSDDGDGNEEEAATNDEADEEEEEEEINWRGMVEVDTIVYPTFKGTLDIDQKESIYIVQATLVLANGTAELFDEFNFEDVFTMSNKLQISTPFASFKELTSEYIFEVVIGEKYVISTDVVYLSNSEWVRSGVNINYTLEMSEDEDLTIHAARFNIFTPFEVLKNLESKLLIEIEENVYRTNVTVSTNHSRTTVAANLEIDKDFMEASFSLGLDTPTYVIPLFKLTARRDFTGAENKLELMLEKFSPEMIVYGIEGSWQHEKNTLFKTKLKILTPFESFPSLGGSVHFSHNMKEEGYTFDALLTYAARQELKLAGRLKSNHLTIELETPLQIFKRVVFNGTLKGPDNNHRTIIATVTYREKTFDVAGEVAMTNEIPLAVKLSTPNPEGRVITVVLSIHKKEDGFAVDAALDIGQESMKLIGEVAMRANYDWNVNMKVVSTHADYSLLSFSGKYLRLTDGNLSLELNTDTSIKGLERLQFSANSLITKQNGRLKSAFDITKAKGEFQGEWVWHLMENMGAKMIGSYSAGNLSQHVTSEIFYRNPKKAFKHVALGVDSNINKNEWQFGVNGTLDLPTADDISLLLNLKMPPPNHDVHTVVGKFQYSKGYAHVLQVLKYFTAYAKDTSYGTSGELNMSKEAIKANLQFEWGGNNLQTVNNVLDVKRREQQIDVTYQLKTPKYEEDTLVALLFYDYVADSHKARANVYSPAQIFISGGDVDFQSIANMNGIVNTTTPFRQLPYLGAKFATTTQALLNQRFAEVFWPNNTAVLNSTYTYDSRDYNTQLNGSVVVEVPLATRHVGKIIYGYKEAPLHKTGYSLVEYNKKQFLEGKYNCASVSSAGFDKDTINIEIENNYHPLGVLYVHQYEYSGGSQGTNLPTIETKKAEVFKLHNRAQFHLSGEVAVRTTFTGQEILLTAVHSNRTVKLKTDYDFLDHQFKSKSLLELDPHAWASYDFTIINKTTTDKTEDHVEINFAYPRRNFTLSGYYQLTNNSLSSDMTFVWDKQAVKKKTFGASVDWKQISVVPNKQHAVVSLKHPSFVRDVTLNAHYYSDYKDLFDVNADLVYSADDSKKLVLSGKVQDHSGEGLTHYNVEILGSHPATRLDLSVNGELKLTPQVYETNSAATYKRAYLPLQIGHAKARLNTRLKEIDVEKGSLSQTSYLRGKYHGKYPTYKINGTVAKGDELNATGYFFANLHEQIVVANVNLTPDASESFHTYGRIPDSRNAVFNIWRVYEDVFVSDVAFYLRLNHSRLVTSKLAWRPEMEEEIKTGIYEFVDTVVETFYGTIDYWKKYIKSETTEAVNGLWLDARPVVQEFLDDIRELKSLENDIEEFKVFLNTSYNANEFYIRDIVNITSYLIDELAIRGHIESFPDILNEVWVLMGESGAAIRSSLIWIIDKIKNSYKNAKEFINSILRGDSMDHVAAMFERLVEKYDKFVKDLHVSFTKHIANLWHKFTELVKHNWNNLLLAVEPSFIKFAHYVETIVWKVSNEVLDFLYERQNDIQRSPYYTKFANFTQDVDWFYKDIKKNSALTNIKKYSHKIYEFLKEKYFTMVPFGKELQNIVTEIIGEFKQLLKLPSINYIISKVNELCTKIEYLYDYFDIGTKTQQLIQFIQMKITDITQTALQADDRYREAKTKFVFDPENGHVELEQKLPMSWHAFNETPRFEEIPEYKAINDVQNYFIASNTTFWTLYYQYKPYTEPSNWLPPFPAQAIMAGPQHFVTFDKSYFEYHGSCSYLLASDFVDNSFSLAVSYNSNNKHDVYEIGLVIDGRTIIVDVLQDSVSLSHVGPIKLPMQFKDTSIYQEAQMLKIENTKGFAMHCNLKYDVCTFSLSGWYYGKTAGLLGTMDNEPSTDYLTSRNTIDKDLGRFAHSWALEPQKCSSTENRAIELQKNDLEIQEKCDLFFESKLSQFSHCFSVVDPAPFMRMCLNSKVVNEHEACTAAVAYMQACATENTPLRIPDACVTCKIVNGTEYPEGQVVDMQGDEVPQSSDVVFIVEAKECNRNIKNNRSIDILISSIAKELSDANLKSNRYGLVVFGGNGVYNEPRSVVMDNNIFTIPQSIPRYFENIPIGNGNNDIFGAIAFAAKLLFRPGVSKTFILLPCSNCDPENMTLDYTVIHHVLAENGITLHILMNDEFIFEKPREGKVFYGMDGETAYTKKDVRILKGDTDLRRQVKLPKSVLGFCTPLSLESNGTVFSARRLETDGKKVNAVKKFSTVFGKRVAKTATPFRCQKCECTADNDGMSYMECFPCELPAAMSIDWGFNEDDHLDMIYQPEGSSSTTEDMSE